MYHGLGCARWGASGPLYPRSASCGTESPPEAGRRGSCSRTEALKAGSCAAAGREPRQIRKEAAVSGVRWVPQGDLVRADDAGETVMVRSTEGARPRRLSLAPSALASPSHILARFELAFSFRTMPHVLVRTDLQVLSSQRA